MAIEIERKFLLANENWRDLVSKSIYYRQGYLNSDKHSSVRIRVSDDTAKINIKSATIGAQRQEYEYDIPADDAHELLNTLCHKPLVEKTRHIVVNKQHIWEIDEFAGENSGLIVAEIELSHVKEAFEKLDWVGEEVTEDVRYYNNQLAKQPYTSW
ncbi:MAG: CYTH domain-containing protein [Gammaproteobacteria bacterium]|jgi:adenylate cyclase|nr:CYTH domain-containing protein [Gammaproteobacteria bacterium]MBT4145935.1 CYTH domain-containing protein [Gammaproteobacteria bacterium]MBT5222758.1 CYTH domain-containing protein [Gammaproteobacteria bacterium]MBT5827143.1 CYTH domain-containing protein [Gammaproteobacteria bacterium]MBT5967004.1 CYTH domain-containing protein [Gammaproteobacteria bacterium]